MNGLNPYSFSLGNVLAQAEDIRAARTRNILAERQLEDDARARDLRAGAVQGDTGSMHGLAVLDPSKANEVITYLNNLDDAERTNVEQNAEDIGRLAWYVQQSDDQEAAYQEVRGMVPEEVRAEMPPTYDEKWVTLQLAQAQSVKELLGQAGSAKVSAQTAIGKAAQDLQNRLITQDQYDTMVAAEMDKVLNESRPEGLETAVTNAIRSTVMSMYADARNPLTGEFSILDPEKAMQAVDMMALAEKISAEQSLPAARAVQVAAEQLKVDLSGDVGGGIPMPSNDPLGLR